LTNPVTFIVGCPRSGTTLLRHIVGAHPQIAITPEAHWIPLWFEQRKGLTPEGWITPELISALLEHPKFTPLFHLGREELMTLVGNGHPVSYASFVAGIFDLYGKARGKTMVGNKTPDSVRRMDTLHELWPQARIVHLIRDGRDVALSLMNWPRVLNKKPGTFPTWKKDPVSTAALWWELNVRCGRNAGKWLGPELYYELRYESLIANPAEECTRLCAFLGLPFDEEMLRFHEKPEKGMPPQGSEWQPVTTGLRDWSTQMTAEDVEVFEAAAGELLAELGYVRTFANLRPDAVEHSVQVRNSLANDREVCVLMGLLESFAADRKRRTNVS